MTICEFSVLSLTDSTFQLLRNKNFLPGQHFENKISHIFFKIEFSVIIITLIILWFLITWNKKKDSHQINSLQIEQNVGCLKNVAMNLWPLTWWTRRFRALRRLCIKPSFSLKIRSLGSSVKITNLHIVAPLFFKQWDSNLQEISLSKQASMIFRAHIWKYWKMEISFVHSLDISLQ